VLRRTAKRSIIDQVTARDLEAIARRNRIEQIVERAFEQARRVAQRVKSTLQRRHELISELRFKKQQGKARKIEQKRGHGPSMSQIQANPILSKGLPILACSCVQSDPEIQSRDSRGNKHEAHDIRIRLPPRLRFWQEVVFAT
jgi:hypothetical protein